MSKALAESIAKLKENSSNENKTEFVSRLIRDKFYVPVIIEMGEKTQNMTKINNIGYYSIHGEKGSFLLVFTSVEAIGAWRKDVQFLELNFNDVCGIVGMTGADYSGILIDNGGNSLALKKDFIDRIKEHIKTKNN